MWQKQFYLSYCSQFLHCSVSTDGVRECNLFHIYTTGKHLYPLKASLLPFDSKCSRAKYIAKSVQGNASKIWENQRSHLNCFPAKKKKKWSALKSTCAYYLERWEVTCDAIKTHPDSDILYNNTQGVILPHMRAVRIVSCHVIGKLEALITGFLSRQPS